LLELVELEVRELLSKYQFPGEATPIVIGSAKMALEGDKGSWGRVDFQAGGGAGQLYPQPQRLIGRAVFDAGGGRVLDQWSGDGGDGRVERGIVKVGTRWRSWV